MSSQFMRVHIASLGLTSRNVQVKYQIHSHLQVALILLISVVS
jgi:hypothetical protein